MNSTDVAVLGAGPGGYVAAFRAADLGMKVTLIDPRPMPGGVRLNEGCIPSKILLHVASVMANAEDIARFGVSYSSPEIDLATLRSHRDELIASISENLRSLTVRRKISYLQGVARFTGPNSITIDGSQSGEIRFEHAIIATGSRAAKVPCLDIGSPRIMDSSLALKIEDITAKMLVVGGGYIGLELGTVYAALGSEITVVEMLPHLLSGVDRDLVRPLASRLKVCFAEIMLKTTVTEAQALDDAVAITFSDAEGKSEHEHYDRVLVSVGRLPNTENLGLETTGVELNAKGFISVDDERRSGQSSIFAVGDVTGGPMLAHKASHEGVVTAEVIAGNSKCYKPHSIPAVIYTDPEIAWCGLSESTARSQKKKVKIARFPWAASGRAATVGRTEGLTKLITDPVTGRILGVGIVGKSASELISQGVMALNAKLNASGPRPFNTGASDAI